MGNAHAVRASAHEFPQVGLIMSSTLSLIQTRRVRIPITVTGASQRFHLPVPIGPPTRAFRRLAAINAAAPVPNTMTGRTNGVPAYVGAPNRND